jgi:hypothetical protein
MRASLSNELKEWFASRRCIAALEHTDSFDSNYPNEILSGGRLWIACEIGVIRHFPPRVSCVISLGTKPYNYERLPNVVYRHIQIEDSPDQNLVGHSEFDSILTWMYFNISTGNNVLVHCAAGLSRSATVCIAYLIRFMHLNLDQAYMVVKCVRPVICPNQGFLDQLIDFE